MLTTARAATSPRRSPGTFRTPASGTPTCCGVSLARREMRNSRTSARLSTATTVRPFPRGWDPLAVHLSPGTPIRSPAGHDYGVRHTRTQSTLTFEAEPYTIRRDSFVPTLKMRYCGASPSHTR
jgi:hypothetical protein